MVISKESRLSIPLCESGAAAGTQRGAPCWRVPPRGGNQGRQTGVPGRLFRRAPHSPRPTTPWMRCDDDDAEVGQQTTRRAAAVLEGDVQWGTGDDGDDRQSGWEDARVVSARAAKVPWCPPPWKYCCDAGSVDALLLEHVYGEGPQDQGPLPGARVVGLDCEWEPVQRAGQRPGRPTVVQVSTETVTVVAHVGAMDDPTVLPASLARVLGDARVVKAGVGVGFDAATLSKWFEVPVEGAVDIGWAAVVLGVGRERTGNAHRDLAHVGLRALVGAFGVDLHKGTMGRSDWSAQKLSDAQVAYAARDAYAGAWALRNLFHARVEPLARLGGFDGRGSAPGMHTWALSLVGKFSLEAHLTSPGLGLEQHARGITDLMRAAKREAREERGLGRAGRRRKAVYAALSTVGQMEALWISDDEAAKDVKGGLGSSRRVSSLGRPGVDATAEVACEVVFRTVVGQWRLKDSPVKLDFGPVQALNQVAVFTGRELLPAQYETSGTHGRGIQYECTVTLLPQGDVAGKDRVAAAVGVGRAHTKKAAHLAACSRVLVALVAGAQAPAPVPVPVPAPP